MAYLFVTEVRMNLSSLHGNLQRLAFLILFPIGGAIALLRHKIGPGWLKYHVVFQITATLIVFIAAAIQIVKWKRNKKIEVKEEHVQKRTLSPILLTHIVVGSMVGLLLIIQIVWAYFARRFVPWDIWYRIHVALAVLIVGGGISNLVIGSSISK